MLLPQMQNRVRIHPRQAEASMEGDPTMVEIALAIAACGAMAKIADADGRSSIVWGIITLGLCLASGPIPLPFLRILLAFIVAFILMMVAKARAGR
jgi:hypothetical protein